MISLSIQIHAICSVCQSNSNFISKNVTKFNSVSSHKNQCWFLWQKTMYKLQNIPFPQLSDINVSPQPRHYLYCICSHCIMIIVYFLLSTTDMIYLFKNWIKILINMCKSNQNRWIKSFSLYCSHCIIIIAYFPLSTTDRIYLFKNRINKLINVCKSN